MGEFKTRLEERLAQVTQTQLVAQAPSHHQQHNVRGKLEKAEMLACSLVEALTASLASKLLLAQYGALLERPSF